MPTSSKPTNQNSPGWASSRIVRVEALPGAAPAELDAIQDALKLLCSGVDWVSSAQAEFRWRDGTPWWSVLATILTDQADARVLRVPGDDSTPIEGIRYLSDRGASPAWCLWDSHGRRIKLRVDPDPDVTGRIVDFLAHAQRLDWPCCARIAASRKRAILKTWIAGDAVGSLSASSRPTLIRTIGRELAGLHVGDDEDDLHLVCSADEHNTIVGPAGNVAFIDLEATRRGSRWVDLAWSEELLCRSQTEREWLWEGYTSRSGCARPSQSLRRDARNDFLTWLSEQLRRAHLRHPDNADISDDMRRVDDAIRSGSCNPIFAGQ